MIQYKIEQSSAKDLTVISIVSDTELVTQDIQSLLRTIADSLEEVHDRKESDETRSEQTETVAGESGKSSG